MRTSKAAATLAAATLLVPSTPATAAPAAGPLTWSVSPSGPKGPNGRPALDYKLDPGATVTDHVAVTNHSGRPLTLRLYAGDAFTTPTGGFDLPGGETRPTGAGSWIKLGRDVVTLPSSSRVVVPITVTVPENATPGDHAAGVVATPAESTRGGVTVEHRVGTRVHLRVTGPLRPELTLTDVRMDTAAPWNPFRLPSITAGFTVANTGNVRLSGEPSARAGGLFGLGSGNGAAPPLPEILPGGSLRTSVTIADVPPLFRQRVTLTVTAGSVRAESHHTLWLIPWPQLALLALVAAAVALRRHRRRRLTAALAAAERRGHDLAMVQKGPT
ncbi:DUF916 domain-containing protein [Actinoplanes sp. NPDC051861]|uniref:WxL protein peptidoglycan domain-containing protein n=1 Tax=Actinoplanes sp. NPDC051861 TaxID=3155170 RepID=UPI003436385B